MKVYGYVRVSTQTQSEHGYGLATQREAIAKYCTANDLLLERVYEDAGISGNLKDTDDDDAINKRAGLIELLAVLEPNDKVIVLNTSRLWRSDLSKAIVKRKLMQCQAHVVSIENPKYDLYNNDPAEYLISAMLEVLDVYDRMNINVKLARGRITKAQAGSKPCGKCPYGYRWSDDRKSVEADPDEAPIVKRMFTLAQSGQSLQKIADTLNAQGSTPRQSDRQSATKWSRGSIHTILRNDFYVGVLHYAGETVKGNHPALVSKVQFGKVGAALSRGRRRH